MRLSLLSASAIFIAACASQPTQSDVTFDAASAPCSAEMPVLSTDNGVEFVRTPDACFSNLPDWGFAGKSVEIDGLRQGYVEAGPADGQVILMLHGQPAWSYLYRYMIKDLAADGYRVIAMDHIGFGLSDKPTDVEYHSFVNHADRLLAFIQALELDEADLTLFAQDWGSIIGLYVAGGNLELFDRMIIGNGGIPVIEAPSSLPNDIEASNEGFRTMMEFVPPQQPAFFDENGNSLLPSPEGGDGTEMFGQWMAFARFDESFVPSKMVEALTYLPLTEEERAAYDAPFPARIAMAGPRIFPSLRNDLVGITQSRKDALETYERPFVTIFGGNDPGLAGEGDGQPWMKEAIPGSQGQPHIRIPDASHFLQDDKGPEVADMVDAFIKSNS